MRRVTCQLATVAAVWAAMAPELMAQPHTDPRLRELTYDPKTVVTVPVKRGVVTLVVLGADEAITEVAVGLGGDCAKPDAAWCVAAQPNGRTLFVKPKSTARSANNLAVVTDRRLHAFRFEVLDDRDRRAPVHRLVIKAPAPPAQPPALRPLAVREAPALANLPAIPAPPDPDTLVAERLQAPPEVRNTDYSVAEGPGAEDIVPTLVFDDGRFTYLKFPGNRELPAVFHVLGDGSETLVNTRMDGELLVVDRVSRRLVLRSGQAVVGLWNEAFDLHGAPPEQGTTVPGVRRTLRSTSQETVAADRTGDAR